MSKQDVVHQEADDLQVNPVMHLIAPLAAIAATMVVRKGMNMAYSAVTGHEAPVPRDPQVRFARAVIWTALTAATAAVVEVAVYRIANQAGSHKYPANQAGSRT